MGKIDEAKSILDAVNSPINRELACYVLLALADIKETDNWSDAKNNTHITRKLMDFMKEQYNIIYKPNTRETVRKDVLHCFLQNSIVEVNRDDPKRATNSPKYCYSLTHEILDLIHHYGKDSWDEEVKKYNENVDSLIKKYTKERDIQKIPVTINGEKLKFGPGAHNKLQKDIIEEFAPRFAQGGEVLYVGDTENKDLVRNDNKLKDLGISITQHDKLPDVVIYCKDKDWLYYIESVTSVGPISNKRMIELKEMSKNCNSGIVYVTAFPDRVTLRKFIADLAWETEVWISEDPDHMMHLNGDRFMGPHN